MVTSDGDVRREFLYVWKLDGHAMTDIDYDQHVSLVTPGCRVRHNASICLCLLSLFLIAFYRRRRAERANLLRCETACAASGLRVLWRSASAVGGISESAVSSRTFFPRSPALCPVACTARSSPPAAPEQRCTALPPRIRPSLTSLPPTGVSSHSALVFAPVDQVD